MKKLFALLGVTALVFAFSVNLDIANADCSSFPGNMYKGVTNSLVKTVQNALISAGYLSSGSNTGYFGSKTQTALKLYQAANGLGQLGFVDQATWQKLVGCGAQQSPAPSGSGDLYIPGILGIGTKGKYNSIIRSAPDSNLYFQTGYSPTTQMVIDPNGNVGIGTIKPLAELHIDRGNANSPALMLSSSGAGFGSGMMLVNNAANHTYSIYANNNGALIFGDEVQEQARMWIDKTNTVIEPNNGNVGIGTLNPTQKLEVNGSVKAKGYITGDITFQQNGQTLWTMSEQPDGLYLKSALTGKLYRLQMTEVGK